MKKIVYVFIYLVIVSCANNETSKSVEINAVEESINDYEVTTNDTKLNLNIDNFTSNEYQNLAIQKLKEVSDLLSLKQQHPEFKDDIEAQLNALITKNTTLNLIESNSAIENISQKGNMEQVSDSVQKMTIHFDLVSENKTVKDSLNAIITSKMVILDGVSVKTNKIQFSNFE